MSFLNPVNLPVKRFKSTDAGAPQINYNARTAGDVKAVLKACLVTGYGDTASAGWSIVNEDGHVCEFVSPDAAMSDYRLGIDDSSASSTTWYYQYQDARVNPAYNSPAKSFMNADKTHAQNGWQLLITGRGLVLIEMIYNTTVAKISTRITFFSATKSALGVAETQNIMFFNIGQNAQITLKGYLYTTTHPHIRLSNYESGFIFGATTDALGVSSRSFDISTIDITSRLFISDHNKMSLIAQIPALLQTTVASADDLYGVYELFVADRPVLAVTAGESNTNIKYVTERAATYLIYLDYWEY